MQYVGQKNSKYADGLLRAMVNACRFWDLPCPDPDSDAWEGAVDFAECRKGPTLKSVEDLAQYFGLRVKSVVPVKIIGQSPVLVTVHNPEIGPSFHTVLAIHWTGNVATVIDYRVQEGPLVERVKFYDGKPPTRTDGEINRDVHWDALYIPAAPNNRCFVLEPV